MKTLPTLLPTLGSRAAMLATALTAAMTLCTAPATAQTAQYDTDRGFVHPGCLHTQADFDRIKAQLAAKDPEVVEGLAKLKGSTYASASFTTSPTETIIRGGNNGENYMNAARGGAAAYLNALTYRITGETKHADCAVKTINQWVGTCKSIGGDTNYALASGLYCYPFVNAAELLRDYKGWKAEDQQAFRDWLLDVWYPTCIGFLRVRCGCWENAGKWWQAPGAYWSNWGLCNTISVISMGIYLDDPFIYNQGVSFYKYDQCGTFKDMTPEQVAKGDGYIWNWGLTEFLGNLVPIESQCTDETMTAFGRISQMQESGRDQGHASMAAGLAIDVCQTMLNQGDDAFALMNDRLAGGLEYVAAYNVAKVDGLPFVPYWVQTSGFTLADGRGGRHTNVSEGGRGQIRPGWTRALAYYEGMRGVKMKYAEMAKEAIGIEGGPGYYGETSGGFDQLGYTTVANTRPACKPEDAIYVLRTSVSYGGKTYQQNELGALTNTYTVNTNTGLKPGTEVTLSVALPEGVADDGQWLWDDGTTLPELHVTADRSRMYHVTYTSARGIVSTANFTLAVQGDSHPDRLFPTITCGDQTVADTIIFVPTGSKVTLAVSSKVGWASSPYLWSNAEGVTSQGREQNGNGKKTQSITLYDVKEPQVLTCTYTNQNKVKTDITFHVYAQENHAMAEGDYFIINRATGEYLTNDGSSYPSCAPLAARLDSAQVWHIAPDGERFKITSLLDDRFLGGSGNFPTTEYSAKSHTFLFEPMQGTDNYNMTRASGSTTYWVGWNTNGRLNGNKSKTPTEYPFSIVAVDFTCVSTPGAARPATGRTYTIGGIQTDNNSKGIIIRDGKKIVFM